MEETDVALFAIIIAGISMFISLGGFFLSKRSYDLVKKEHNEKYDQISSYLIEAIKWNEDDTTYCSFATSYTNTATTQNSLSDIVLEIDYYDKDNVFNKIKIVPSQEKAPIGLIGNYKQLTIPITLSAKETSSGWVTFKLPSNQDTFAKIEVYRICANTPTGDKLFDEAHILRKVSK